MLSVGSHTFLPQTLFTVHVGAPGRRIAPRWGSSDPVVRARSPALVAGSLATGATARPGHAAGRPGSCQGVAGARPRPLGPRRRASEGAARAPARGDPEGTAAPCPLSRAPTRAIKPHRERNMRARSRASASAIKKHPKTCFCPSQFEGDTGTSLLIASRTRMRSALDRSFLIAVGRITLNWENCVGFAVRAAEQSDAPRQNAPESHGAHQNARALGDRPRGRRARARARRAAARARASPT